MNQMTIEGTRLRIADQGGITTVHFIDRNILDEANIKQIGDEISEVIDAQVQPRILISFENVDHLSSAALGTLITINKKVKNREGILRLANIDPQIYEVFKITQLDRIFSIHDSSEEALASF